MKALERQGLLADRSAVRAILERVPPEDQLGRASFEARLAEIDERLLALEQEADALGSVALIFQGEPVEGSRSIDANFASDVLKSFQDIVTKRVAVEEVGELGERGPLPLRSRTSLGISNLLRGSVGFVLEEQTVNAALADTVIKRAIDDVTTILEKAASDSDDLYDEAVQALDNRLLGSLRGFFTTLDDANVQMRIVEGDKDAQFDRAAVHRARVRFEGTNIVEREEDNLVGELLGILPDAPARFEMRLRDGQRIRGSVVARVAQQYLELIERPEGGIVGRWWRVRMKIREVHEPNKPPRLTYSLLGLIEEQGPAAG